MTCGLPAPLSLNVSVPVRVVPLADPTLVKLTAIVQDAPGAMVAPVQVSTPTCAPLAKEKVVGDPPAGTVLATVTFAPPGAAVFVNVSVPVPVTLAAPLGKVMVNGFGRIVTAGRVATPVPVSATGVPVTVTPV